MFKIKKFIVRCLQVFRVLQSMFPSIFINRKTKRELRQINKNLNVLIKTEPDFL